MSKEDSNLGYRKRGQAEIEKALKERAEQERRIAEDVMNCRPFRIWLTHLANKYGYLATPVERTPYEQGANNAVRHIINNLVKTTSMGAPWLAEYSASFYKDKETK